MSCLQEEKGTSCLLDGDYEVSEVKRRRRQRALTLCEVCNIQLNSSAQAQIHYNGKTHQRRLRQANRARTGSRAGNSARSLPEDSPLPTSLPVQPQMDLNYILPIGVNSASPLSLFPNFDVMDPVQKAVISHTFSIAQSPRKKQIITCNICHLRFNSTNQAEAHYKGHKHARKLKAVDKLKNIQRILGKSVWRERKREKAISDEIENGKGEDTNLSEGTAPSPASNSEDDSVQSPVLESQCGSKSVPESTAPVTRKEDADLKRVWNSESKVKENRNRRKRSESLRCAVCKVTVNSDSQLEDHYKGSKHRLMLGGRCKLSRKRREKVGSSRSTLHRRWLPVNSPLSTDQSHHCSVCDVEVNSEAQLRQHMSSRRHRVFNPFINNSSHSVLTTKLTLQQQLSRTLSPTFLTSALTPTGPLSLNHLHPQASIVHASLFSHTLFKPAPSPLRAAHGPIVFSLF